MDIQMPVKDGIEATKEIRQLEIDANTTPPRTLDVGLRKSVPSDARATGVSMFGSSAIILALTASSLESDRVNALAAGCNDFLTKPVDFVWLNNKIIEWGSLKALQMWATVEPRFAADTPKQKLSEILMQGSGRRHESNTESSGNGADVTKDVPSHASFHTTLGKQNKQSTPGEF
jgi:CheY-like chemotaxis protein